MAGSLLLMVVPMALAAALLRGAPASVLHGSNDAATDLASARPPSVSISIEPPGFETDRPVVLPGYLLPDDGTGSEEPAHAGG